MTSGGSALYAGRVIHRRLAPCGYLFSYRVFSALLDLDDLAAMDRLRLFSVNRFNLFSFFETDHGADEAGGLKRHIETLVCGTGIDVQGGKISLLCYPRVLGYAFNPLSVYFCNNAAGDLSALVYEVTNTFGERHRYLFAVETGAAAPLRHACAKALYVSPFIGMDATYRFAVVPPAENLAISIREEDAGTPVLNASFTARRAVLSDRTLARFALAYFAMGFKIIGGIHWEAFKLWCKGVRVHRHRATEANGFTTVDQVD